MNVAVISNNTFDEAYLKKHIEQTGKYTLGCVITNPDVAKDELSKSEYDVIMIDYYDKSMSIRDINIIADAHPSAIVVLLADVDDKEELKLLKQLEVEYATIYNLKNPPSESDFVEHLDAMFEAKASEAPPITIAQLLLGIVILILILGSLSVILAR